MAPFKGARGRYVLRSSDIDSSLESSRSADMIIFRSRVSGFRGVGFSLFVLHFGIFAFLLEVFFGVLAFRQAVVCNTFVFVLSRLSCLHEAPRPN